MKKYIVFLNHAGETVNMGEFNTQAEAEQKYAEEVRMFDGKEEYHTEDNTDEWIYLSIEAWEIDEDGEPTNQQDIKTSKWYYRRDVL